MILFNKVKVQTYNLIRFLQSLLKTLRPVSNIDYFSRVLGIVMKML